MSFIYLFKGTNFLDEAILFAVGEEEDETPHDWQMFFDGAVNQNGNGVGFLHAILKLVKRSPYSHSCQVEVLLHKQYRRIFCVYHRRFKEAPST